MELFSEFLLENVIWFRKQIICSFSVSALSVFFVFWEESSLEKKAFILGASLTCSSVGKLPTLMKMDRKVEGWGAVLL